MQRLAGALVAGLIDWALEDAWHKAGKPKRFPWIELTKSLPPVDDWLVLLSSLFMYGYGVLSGVKEIQEMGEGALAYSVGMLTHHTLLRNITYRRG